MRHFIWPIALVVVGIGRIATIASQALGPESLLHVLTTLGLTATEIAAVDGGRPLAKVLSWGTASEVYVFGAVHINGPSDTYVRTVRDIARLSTTPGYLGAGELRDDATVGDLTAVTLDADDVKALKNCKEGSCDIQLPAPRIDDFHNRIDWSRPDIDMHVNALARPMVLQLLRLYQQGGNQALGEYRDKKNPARIAEQFETMLQRASALPDVLPELRRYLLEYPHAALPAADSYFYWEQVDFGLKPTIRLNHGVIYRGLTEGRKFAIVAIKQLYATHYFHTALDVSACVDDGTPSNPGFYLLTLKGSQQEGLTGVKGSLLRKVVVDKTRASLERALGEIKRMIEQSSAEAARSSRDEVVR